MRLTKTFWLCAAVLSCASQPAARPAWVDKPEAVYNRAQYLAASGSGTSRNQAEAAAFGNLAALFGQSVKSNLYAVEEYRERVHNGKLTLTTSQDARQAVELSSSIEQLFGAEIHDRWEDRAHSVCYASAVMEKQRAIRIYTELLDANLRLITQTLDHDGESFDSLRRYGEAAELARANEIFATVLIVLGGPNRKAQLKTEAGYRAELTRLARQIPVVISVRGDAQGQLAAAFASVFSGAGLALGIKDARYRLDAELTLAPLPSNDAKLSFTRWTLSARLVDSRDGAVLFPSTASGREGHFSQTEADSRALRAAEASIRETFAASFAEFLGTPGG